MTEHLKHPVAERTRDMREGMHRMASRSFRWSREGCSGEIRAGPGGCPQNQESYAKVDL